MIATKAQAANLTTLQELTDWCIEHSIDYPTAIWAENGLTFTCWKFLDDSKARFDPYFNKLVELTS